MRAIHFLTASLALGGGGCSLILDWDPNSLPCDRASTNQCLEGYSCRIDTCILDYSLVEGETCNQTQQCQKGLICPPRIFSCRKQCNSYYASDPLCSPETACIPLFDSSEETFLGSGACLPSECSDPGQCDVDQDCVEFKPNVGKCFDVCEYNITGGAYADNAIGFTCHPVGPPSPGGEQPAALVTWQIGTRTLGETCDSVAQPCAEGLVCLGSAGSRYCHQLCDATVSPSGCSGGKTCITVNRVSASSTGSDSSTGWDYCSLQ